MFLSLGTNSGSFESLKQRTVMLARWVGKAPCSEVGRRTAG